MTRPGEPRPLLPAVVGPWAAYVIARDYGDELVRHAAALEASPTTAVLGRQLRAAVAQMREAGRQQLEAHRASQGWGSVDGTAELPVADDRASSEVPPWMHLTVDQVAGKVGLSESYVRRLCRNEALPATKRGRQWLIDSRVVADLETLRSTG